MRKKDEIMYETANNLWKAFLAQSLLKNVSVKLSGMTSKNGKKYILVLEYTGKYVNFKNYILKEIVYE